MKLILLGGDIAFAVFIMTSSILISRQVTIPVKQMVSMADDLAHGEGYLTKRLGLTHMDEVGKAAGLIDRHDFIGFYQEYEAARQEWSRDGADNPGYRDQLE